MFWGLGESTYAEASADKKKGKLTASHRYNLTPLLHSCPGGLEGAGRTGLTRAQM